MKAPFKSYGQSKTKGQARNYMLPIYRCGGIKSNVLKGEKDGNQHFLPFPQCFLSFPKQFSTLESHSFCRLKNTSDLIK